MPTILNLKFQTRFAGRIGQRLDAPVITKSGAIEGNGVDTGRLCLFRNTGTYYSGCLDIAGALCALAHVLFDRRGRYQHGAAIGRNYLRANPVEDADPKMNRRGMRLSGEIAVVTSAIDGGTGRVKHGDSEWLAKGCDAAVGDKVRISGSDGAVLIVEPL